MSVTRLTEIIAGSKKSFEKAVENVIERANKTLKKCRRGLGRKPESCGRKWTGHRKSGGNESYFCFGRLNYRLMNIL